MMQLLNVFIVAAKDLDKQVKPIIKHNLKPSILKTAVATGLVRLDPVFIWKKVLVTLP